MEKIMDFPKIAVLENQFEAQYLKEILDEREIPHFLRSYHDTAYDGLFQMQKGWGVVNAPEEFHEEIIEIIEEIRAQQPLEDDEIVE
jgi:hypothetical protein